MLEATSEKEQQQLQQENLRSAGSSLNQFTKQWDPLLRQRASQHAWRSVVGNPPTSSQVLNKRDKSISMAFCFELRKKKYFPVVERDSENKMSLKIQAQNEPKKFSERFLFRWAENNGEYGSLCSVAEPSQYLCVCKNKVTISSNPDLGFRVQFLESNSFKIRMLRVHNSGIGEGHEGHARHSVRRKALQWVATRGGRKTSEKKKSMV
ncbi:hypothetical protein PGIGA_G00150340 [Pangasianodon gigas]|uniref:Uncharacterized protein n=1 Tax=Pangasianodon gigas TaxID=30993 RepID=A0ACC5XPY1_PANGG|nr:hypothetical protein [Pangasianodon gigas]